MCFCCLNLLSFAGLARNKEKNLHNALKLSCTALHFQSQTVQSLQCLQRVSRCLVSQCKSCRIFRFYRSMYIVCKLFYTCAVRSSQNVQAAGHLTAYICRLHLAAYNEISAVYFTLVRLVFRTKLFRIVVHHCKVQIILIKYCHFSYDVVPLITTFQLHTASLHRFSGHKVSSKLLVQIVTKKYITQTRAAHNQFCRNALNIVCSWLGEVQTTRSLHVLL